MNLFPFLSKKKVDEEILNLYLEIEVLIIKINNEMDQFLRYKYYPHIETMQRKRKGHYSIKKIGGLLKRIKQEIGDCFTIRMNKKRYHFKSTKDTAEKEKIVTEQKKIKNLLKHIEFEIKRLRNTTYVKDASLEELERNLENIFKEENKFRTLINNDKIELIRLMEYIYEDSGENIKNGVWLIDRNDKGKKLFFSCSLTMDQLRCLELLPLLDSVDVILRSSFVFELHRDKTLNLYHYNLEYKKRNIHVIPSIYKNNLKLYNDKLNPVLYQKAA